MRNFAEKCQNWLIVVFTHYLHHFSPINYIYLKIYGFPVPHCPINTKLCPSKALVTASSLVSIVFTYVRKNLFRFAF